MTSVGVLYRGGPVGVGRDSPAAVVRAGPPFWARADAGAEPG